MVNPSPWPILATFSVFNVLTGIILYLNLVNFAMVWIFIHGFLFVWIINCWFTDIIREATFEGFHTTPVQKGLSMGMILFIVSEVMLFFSFFWGFFHFALSPAVEIGCVWPPYGVQSFDYMHIPLYNTFVLLISGVCVTWTHNEVVLKAIKNKVNTYISMILTLFLALHFTYWQLSEYVMASFHIADGCYGTIFFISTGFHGFHVVLGTLYLIESFYRIIQFHFTRRHHAGLEFAIWYWHFVDVIWLFLFIVIYWWSWVSII